jgi:hypothetical protein
MGDKSALMFDITLGRLDRSRGYAGVGRSLRELCKFSWAYQNLYMRTQHASRR